jgi:DNA recombination protein RmuC
MVMQLALLMAWATLLVSVAILIVLWILLSRFRAPRIPDAIQQIPERLSKLEALHEQLLTSLREGLREGREENGAGMTGVRDNLDQNLFAVRNEVSTLKSEIVEQLSSLLKVLPERVTAIGTDISKDTRQFIDAVTAKLETTNGSLRSEIQMHITAMRTVLIGNFSELSDRTKDAIATLQSSVLSRLDSTASSIKTEHQLLRSSLETSFTALKTESTTALNQSEHKQTTNNAAFQEGIDRAFNRLSFQLKDSLDVQTNQLLELTKKTDSSLVSLKDSVEQRLTAIAHSNEIKLEQTRETVDEKLHSTLEKRLSDSFGLVSDQLSRVQTGLGEMKDLASNVGDLKKVLTNVKSRGGFAEVQLGAQLENALARNQYKMNVRVKPETSESVEFAICLPGNDGEECLLPIDAKFPKEAWERLENARETGNMDAIGRATDIFESGIKVEAKRISEKYINAPATTPFAYMYLPTEALFAQVARSPGLMEEMQRKYRVSIAGPTTMMALLISFQMGFQTLAIQKKGTEVWNVLAAAKTQFGKFGDLMTQVERKVGSVQQTLQEIGTRTRVINRTLSAVDTVQDDTQARNVIGENAKVDITNENGEAAKGTTA